MCIFPTKMCQEVKSTPHIEVNVGQQELSPFFFFYILNNQTSLCLSDIKQNMRAMKNNKHSFPWYLRNYQQRKISCLTLIFYKTHEKTQITLQITFTRKARRVKHCSPSSSDLSPLVSPRSVGPRCLGFGAR